MTTQPDEPDGERELSWAEVYSSRDCGNCAKTDCPRCANQFLEYLKTNGTSRAAQARG